MAGSVSDRFSVLKDHAEKLLLQGTRYNSFPFWQVFGAFCPCRHLRFLVWLCLPKGCNRNPYNWNNIALNVHFEASQEDGHGYFVRICRILHYDLKIQQADRNEF